jgi:hypothetical protein
VLCARQSYSGLALSPVSADTGSGDRHIDFIVGRPDVLERHRIALRIDLMVCSSI